MAARSWAGSTAIAVGIAAGAGAAQLGLGYGLGIVEWLPTDHQDGKLVWLASLAWVIWIASTSTVIGGMAAHWLASGSTTRTGFVLGIWRTTIALAAALGAMIIAPLGAVPARTVHRADNFAPEWQVAGYAATGVIIGLAIAIAAVVARAVALNVIASAGYVWVLAAVAVTDGLLDGTDPALAARLAIWKFSSGQTVRGFYVPGVLTMLVAAFLIGLAASWRAGRRGDNRVGVAISGAAGPFLVAAAYLLAAPQFAGADNVDLSQWSAYLFAPYAVIAGLAGSVFTAAMGPRGKNGDIAESGTLHEAEGAVPIDDDLKDWPATLEATKSTVGTTKRRTRSTSRSTKQPKPPEDQPQDQGTDLADDAYAPPRAYRDRDRDTDAKAYATDTVDPAPASGSTSSAKAGGRPASPPPLWPARSDENGDSAGSGADGTGGTGERSSGRGRRSKR